MKHFNGLGGLWRGGVLDKGKAPGFSGKFIQHQVDRREGARLGEILPQVIFPGLVREITHEEFGIVHEGEGLEFFADNAP